MANGTEKGLFIPTTAIFDDGYIQNINLHSQEFKEMLIKIRKTISDVATVLNKKVSGLHPLEEFVTGTTYFADPALNSTTASLPVERPEFCTTINFGALPNAGTKSVAHNITFPTGTNTFRFVEIIGAASDLTGKNYIPIPYSSTTLVNNVEINVDSTNVNIITGIDRTAFTDTIIRLKYIKS